MKINKAEKPTADDYRLLVEKSGDRKFPWRWSVLRKGVVADTNLSVTYAGAFTFAERAAIAQWSKDFMESPQ